MNYRGPRDIARYSMVKHPHDTANPVNKVSYVFANTIYKVNSVKKSQKLHYSRRQSLVSYLMIKSVKSRKLFDD